MKARCRAKERRTRWVAFLTVALLLAAFSLRYRLTLVVGASMEPTLWTGDLCVVNRWAYRSAGPTEGDIVLARDADGYLIKRVVGLPGQSVEVRNGVVYVDARPRALPDVRSGTGLDLEPGVLGAGRYALLGDRRQQGPRQTAQVVVGRSDLVGKLVLRLRLWPPSMAALKGGSPTGH